MSTTCMWGKKINRTELQSSLMMLLERLAKKICFQYFTNNILLNLANIFLKTIFKCFCIDSFSDLTKPALQESISKGYVAVSVSFLNKFVNSALILLSAQQEGPNCFLCSICVQRSRWKIGAHWHPPYRKCTVDSFILRPVLVIHIRAMEILQVHAFISRGRRE